MGKNILHIYYSVLGILGVSHKFQVLKKKP